MLELRNSNMWWCGPNKDVLSNLRVVDQLESVPEQRTVAMKSTVTIVINLFERYSKLKTLIDVFAYCRRFITNCRCSNKSSGELTVEERTSALLQLVKYAQWQSFSSDIQNLIDKKPLERSSTILSLDPFLDRQGILRVGGRLVNADIAYERRHQILLPKGHKLTYLLANAEHIKTCIVDNNNCCTYYVKGIGL